MRRPSVPLPARYPLNKPGVRCPDPMTTNSVVPKVVLLMVVVVLFGCAPERVDERLLKLPSEFNVVQEFEAPNPAGGPAFVSNYLVVHPHQDEQVQDLVERLRSYYEELGLEFDPSSSRSGTILGTGRGLVSIGVLSEFVGADGSIDAATIEQKIAGLTLSNHVLVTASPR